MVWTWRSTPDAINNHDLSYARTLDFMNWETGKGLPLTLPIKLSTADIVDPVPVNGGMINNNTKVGFDANGRPVIVYHKYDANGNTQLYNARIEDGVWKTHQVSNWKTAWRISGYNTLVFPIEVTGLRAYSDGTLRQAYLNTLDGDSKARQSWRGFELNQTDLSWHADITAPLPYPIELNEVESKELDSKQVGMRVRWAEDKGTSSDPDVYYMMRWETFEPNGDQPRAVEPTPTVLRVYAMKRSVMQKLQ
jgi:hypothetical protein